MAQKEAKREHLDREAQDGSKSHTHKFGEDKDKRVSCKNIGDYFFAGKDRPRFGEREGEHVHLYAPVYY